MIVLKRILKKKLIISFSHILFLSSLFGFLIGCILYRYISVDFLMQTDFLFVFHFSSYLDSEFWKLTLKLYSALILFLIFIFLFGLSIHGTFFMPLLFFIRAFFLGADSSYTCMFHGFGGAFWNLLVIFPGAYLSYRIFLFAAERSKQISSGLFSLIRDQDKKAPLYIRSYFRSICMCSISLFVPSVINGLMSLLYGSLFSFD